ncbi:MAG: peptidase T [Prevotella sp.]|nr:peptidase T [Prevotella sp.]
MTLLDRFLAYTRFDTQSSEESTTVPSTAKQLVFARYLKGELEGERLTDVYLDPQGYLYATLPGNVPAGSVPTIGFISHYDTSPDCLGAGVRARVVEHYDGSAIQLSPGIVSSPDRFPELLRHVGEDLIVTDGHTLLGADDKAGIAEIVEAMCWLRDHPEVRHGDIRVAFNPDEEIGLGAQHFDVQRFGCAWAYTMDGGDVGELEYENFNAASARVVLRGVSVHPGYAKGKMVNACRLAMEFTALLPAAETPEQTEGYEGFFHLTSMQATVEEARLSYIIRDHSRERFESRKLQLQQCAQQLNACYGEGTATADIRDQYYNMREQLAPCMHIVDRVVDAMKAVGVTPVIKPIRGGTDGAQLSFRGLPCPNIFAGGVNFHGPYEFVSLQTMQQAVRLIVEICKIHNA